MEESGKQVSVGGPELPWQACSCLHKMSRLQEAPHSQTRSSWRAGTGTESFLRSRRDDLTDEQGTGTKKETQLQKNTPRAKDAGNQSQVLKADQCLPHRCQGRETVCWAERTRAGTEQEGGCRTDVEERPVIRGTLRIS